MFDFYPQITLAECLLFRILMPRDVQWLINVSREKTGLLLQMVMCNDLSLDAKGSQMLGLTQFSVFLIISSGLICTLYISVCES